MKFIKRIQSSLASSSFDRLYLVLFLIEFARGAILVSYLPVYAADRLGLAVSAIGMAVSIHYLVDSFVKLGIGFLMDRMSQKSIIVSGLVLCILSLLLMNHAHSTGRLLLSSALLGLGGSPLWLACITRIDPGRRSEQMGMLYFFWLAGMGAGPVVINFAIGLGYKTAFTVILILLAAAVPIALSCSFRRGAVRPVLGIGAQCLVFVSRAKSMGIVLPIMIVQTLAGGLLLPVLSRFAKSGIGLTPAQLSFVIISGGAAAGLSLVPLGKLNDRLSGKGLLTGGFSVIAFAIFLLPFTRRFPEAELLAILIGISYAALLPAWNALLASYVPENAQGAGWGLMSAVEGTGVILGPLAGGWLAERFQLSAPIWGCAALFGLCAALYIAGVGKRHRAEVPSY
ncbi:MFS transporter [Cohnella ginsengisoli]|uniref:MFS transporter n=1 Tax=Cohnella ginsengisoli TaxID=425004 RepID=A0A9X4KJZ8_9BACL|nr:MFS transporter [Cohnella ginsengisoli]MDG0793448.1 MFS transporter [Cohnella ginsengisoli]